MTRKTACQRETLLIEILHACLDLREKAHAAEAPMLVYLADVLARRARAELQTNGAEEGAECAILGD